MGLSGAVAPLGIGVTSVQPGPIRTDFSGRSLVTGERWAADEMAALHDALHRGVHLGADGVLRMTVPQILSFAVIAGMMAAFIWGKYRYDLVAACTLLVALALGVVPLDDAFSGFSNDIVIIVGSAPVLPRWRPGRTRTAAAAADSAAPRGAGSRSDSP